ncbi:unnamed protein product [Fusarium graminearum]|nr:unnamed protein product [Fusarium graminearum]CAG1968498.1 unnamed protein product [Fusarium graminearum]CAG1982984.1 unnamed protein product [Fusarium graminearum]VTO82457.1 unnamed protein product [Fusarium graminearum]
MGFLAELILLLDLLHFWIKLIFPTASYILHAASAYTKTWTPRCTKSAPRLALLLLLANLTPGPAFWYRYFSLQDKQCTNHLSRGKLASKATISGMQLHTYATTSLGPVTVRVTFSAVKDVRKQTRQAIVLPLNTTSQPPCNDNIAEM